MAQYIALAASVMSILAPTMKKNGSDTTSRLHRGGGGGGGSVVNFSSGIATGIALGVILLSEFQKRRIRERIRHNIMVWLKSEEDSAGDGDEGEESKATNENMDDIEPIALGEDSIMEIIANCNITLSPNLHCSKITLKRGTRTVTQESKGVEVYYILYGAADFLLNDNNETSTVGVNESILIPPWTPRIISNNSNDKVVFLRISDAGDDETQNNANIIVEKIDEQGRLSTVIKNGLKKYITRSKEE